MTGPDTLGLPAGCALIEVHVANLQQLFHSLDPTPFRERDLDPKAEEFIEAEEGAANKFKGCCAIRGLPRWRGRAC